VDKNVVELSGDLHRQPTAAEIARAVAATEEQVLELVASRPGLVATETVVDRTR
jgi:hypothetical protein